MKAVATGFLVFAAIVYLFTRYLEHRDGADVAAWVGYVRAASEAGMVGALADWFAVTALFRHPMGLPIPHTAIIPQSKDRIGEALATFLKDHPGVEIDLAKVVHGSQSVTAHRPLPTSGTAVARTRISDVHDKGKAAVAENAAAPAAGAEGFTAFENSTD